jgi:hypothetical protein
MESVKEPGDTIEIEAPEQDRPRILDKLRTHKKAAIVIVGITIIVGFNLYYHPPRRELARRYELWLEDVEAPTGQGFRASVTHPPIVELHHRERGSVRVFSIAGEKEPDKALRMLQLVREADLFSLPDRSVAEGELFSVKIRSGDQIFEHSFEPTQIASNPPAALLLTLFPIYAEDSSAHGKE